MATVIASPVATYQADALTQQKSNGDILIATQVNQWINDLRELNDAVHGTLAVPAWTVTGAISCASLIAGATSFPAGGQDPGVYVQGSGTFRGASSGTDATNKTARFEASHYTNAEEPLATILGTSTSTTGVVQIGGGSSLSNASTQISVYTASNNTTVTGTLRATWGNSGTLTQYGNLTLTSASPLVSVGDGTGSCSVYQYKSETGNNESRQYSAGVLRYNEIFDNAESMQFRMHDSGGTLQYTTTYANSNGRWTFPAAVRIDGDIQLSTGSRIFRAGTGTPEAAVTAAVGSLFMRTDGGAGTCFYVKESGAGNTGWVAK